MKQVLLPLALTFGLAQAVLAEDPIVALGAYVATDDLDRSVAFYQGILDRNPLIALPDFVAFEVSGGWFAVVSRDRYAPGSVPGSGAVPYVQSTDLEAIRTRFAVASTQAAPAVIEESGIHLLQLRDPDGQLIEFFRLVSD